MMGVLAIRAAPGRCERLPAHTPLRTVRESFPSHGSSLAKDTSVVRVPRLDGKRGVMRTHLNHIGQLGNTGLRPFPLRSLGRQLRDAPSDWHRSSFAFPGLRRFNRLSCHSRPDRRGHIRRVTGDTSHHHPKHNAIANPISRQFRMAAAMPTPVRIDRRRAWSRHAESTAV